MSSLIGIRGHLTNKKVVSEKTLEVNLCAEILHAVRKMPGCAKAFWIGMKQQQEATNGIDDLIASLPKGVHLALQFKAPSADPRDTTPYRFAINEGQRERLARLATRRPKAVHYVLPHLNTLVAVRTASPDLMSETRALAVASVRPLGPGYHRLFSDPPTYYIKSEPQSVELRPLTEVINDVLGDSSERELLTNGDFREWFTGLFEEARRVSSDGQYTRRHIGKLLEGFSTVCVA